MPNNDPYTSQSNPFGVTRQPRRTQANAFDADNDGVVDSAEVANSVAWANVTGKPALSSATHNLAASVDPTIVDDMNAGYAVGSVWVNTTSDSSFICVDASSAAAIWCPLTARTTVGSVLSTLHTLDVDNGHQVGDVYVDGINAFICLDNSSGFPTWKGITQGGFFSKAVDPLGTDDIDDNYQVGDQWYNYTDQGLFICTDNSSGAAVWLEITAAAGSGDVVGPASAVDSRIAAFDTTTGKLLKDGGKTIAELQAVSEKGAANGYAGLDGGGKVPIAQLPSAVVGAVQYQGTWNATTNTPTLTSGVGTQGHYYKVSVAGSTNLDGVTDWQIGDWAIYNGTAWEKVDNTDQVSSVFGRTGAVVAAAWDYNSSQVLDDSTLGGGGQSVAASIDMLDVNKVNLDGSTAFTGYQTFVAGTVGAPGINFVGSLTSGFYTPSAGTVGVSAAGSLKMQWSSGGTTWYGNLVGGDAAATVYAGLGGYIGVTSDTKFYRDAANTFAMRNGVNPQTLRIYGDYTSGSIYSRISLSDDGLGTATLKAEALGGVTDIDLLIQPFGTGQVLLGYNVKFPDAGSGAGAARTIYGSGGDSTSSGGDLTVGAGSAGSSGGTGGTLLLEGGAGPAGTGGTATLISGTGDMGGSSGDTTVTTAAGDNGTGSLYLKTGTPTGSGSAGDIWFEPGTDYSGSTYGGVYPTNDNTYELGKNGYRWQLGGFAGLSSYWTESVLFTLTDGATINWDSKDGMLAQVTLGGTRTMAAPTNLKQGTYVLIVKQDGIGGRTITWNAVFKWPGGTAPTLSTGVNAVDIISFVCDGTYLYGVSQLNFS